MNSSKKDKRKFAHQMIAALRASGMPGQIEFDEAKFCLTLDNSAGVLDLSNAFQEFSQADEFSRLEIIERYVRSCADRSRFEFPETQEALLTHVLPMVKMRVLYEMEALEVLSGERQVGGKSPFSPLGEYFGVSIALDYENVLTGCPQAVLDECKIDFTTAALVAKANLEQRSLEPFTRIREGLYQSPWQDSYDATRILLTDKIRGLQVKGDHVALCANRDHLYITGSQDISGLTQLCNLTDYLTTKARFMCGVPLRLGPTGWGVFMPAPGHCLYPRFRCHEADAIQRSYNTQRESLAEAYPSNYAAELTQYRDQNNRPQTVSTWIDEAPVLLPKSDMVTFATLERGVVGVATWAAFVKFMRHRYRPLGIWPERYEGLSFPSADELEAASKESQSAFQ